MKPVEISDVRSVAGCATTTLALALITAAPVSAQGTPPPGVTSQQDVAAELQEILVTARKRSETLQDVPVAIQALTAETLQRYSANSMIDVARLATQVQIYPTSSGSGALMSIRGISSSTLDPGVDTSVAVNIDGMGISRGRVIKDAMFDLDSIEILKGPQALFFGKNSPAGVITVRSADPTPDWRFKLRSYYELVAQEFIGEAVASGPVTDNLRVRIAYQGSESRGWVENRAQPRGPIAADPYTLPGAINHYLGGYQNHIGRLSLDYQPTDRLQAKLKVLGSHKTGDATASLNEVISCSGSKPIAKAFVDPSGDCRLNGIVSAGALPVEFSGHYRGLEGRSDTRPYYVFDSAISTLEITYGVADHLSLTSVTGLDYYDSRELDGFDATVYVINSGYETERNTTVSQEVRLLSTFDSPFNFMLGGYYEHFDRNFTGSGTLLRLVDPATGRDDNWQSAASTAGQTVSPFAQLIWKFAPQFELAGGARYTYENKHEVAANNYVNSFLKATFLPVGTSVNPRFVDHNVSPEVTLRWKPNEDITLYGAYKSGYKSGGFSGQVFFAARDNAKSLTFAEEKSGGVEAGLKGVFLDHTLRFNLAAYSYKFEGIQDTVFNAATLSATIFNADARTNGVEFDVVYKPSRILSLRAQAGYNDAHYLSFRNAPCFGGQTVAEGCVPNTTGLGGPSKVQDISGRTRPFAPKATVSGGFTADIPLGGNYLLSLSNDLAYSGGYLTQVPNSPGSAQRSYVLYDASLRFAPVDGRWSVACVGKDLNNRYIVGASADKPAGVRGDIYGQVIRARQVALEATAKF